MEIQGDGLWLVFCVAGNRYAIDSSYVGGVLIMPDEIVGVPESEPYVKGIVKVRGAVISVLDMRTLFGYPTLEETAETFRKCMEKGRADHIEWVDELRACVSERRLFQKSADSHQCAFGRWLDSYEAPIPVVNAKLALIDEPHEEIHKIALRVNQLLGEPDGEVNHGALQRAVAEAEELKDRILNCIRAAETAFHDSFRMMLVTLQSDNDRSIALLVDEIVGVEKLQEVVHDSTLDKMDHSELIGDVAMDSSGTNLLLLLDCRKVLDLGRKLERLGDETGLL